MTRIITASLLLPFIALGNLFAQEKEDEDTIYPEDESIPSVKCIRPKMIRSTEVVDERNILFYMRGDKIYRNVLPRPCTNLQRFGAFSYPTTYGRLCDVDRISLIGQGGAGLSQGFQCRLGKFYPLTQKELDAIRLEAERVEALGVEDLSKEKE